MVSAQKNTTSVLFGRQWNPSETGIISLSQIVVSLSPTQIKLCLLKPAGYDDRCLSITGKTFFGSSKIVFQDSCYRILLLQNRGRIFQLFHSEALLAETQWAAKNKVREENKMRGVKVFSLIWCMGSEFLTAPVCFTSENFYYFCCDGFLPPPTPINSIALPKDMLSEGFVFISSKAKISMSVISLKCPHSNIC